MSAPATPTSHYRIEGLDEPVEIILDRYGVPHIYGHSANDVYLAQGFAVARDRLWQIDTWRKRGLGQLAGDYGSALVAADRAARLFVYRGDMEAEWACYGPQARAAAQAFVRGINGFVGLAQACPQLMPLEFVHSGTRPALWEADDCVRIRSHGPIFNLSRELVRADIIAELGLEAEAARRRLEPEWRLRAPCGIAAEPIPAQVRQIFELATNLPLLEPGAQPEAGGSNNWAIAPQRTATGRAILANDPHRLLNLPSLRYVSHLVWPGSDVIGAGEPGVPGLSIGHNGTCGWGLTIHPADQCDLYVYELHPDDPMRYRFGDGWEDMTRLGETLPVRDASDLEIELLFTRHGPVLHIDPRRRRAYALRSIWSEPGAAPYMGALRIMEARGWDDFVAARAHWRTPPVNHVYADTRGDIGWIMSGSVPARHGGDGLVPVAGDGSSRWEGFMPPELHPRAHNPARGWVASANEMNLPADFDLARYQPGFEWCDPSRYRVIEAGLAQDGHTMVDSCRLQTSFACENAQRLVAMLRALEPPAPAVRPAHELLVGWDGTIASDSPAALLFEIWFRKHLIEAVCEAMAPGAFARFDAHSIAHYDTRQITEVMVAPDTRLGPRPEAVRDSIVVKTLAAAWREARALAGDDPAAWRWGDHHHARFVHPLSRLIPDHGLTTRRVPKGGSGLTPNAADYRLEDFRMTVGASFRMVLDVGEWDNSVFVNAPGQSGNPASPHFDDHLEPWGEESYLPLLYTRERIEAAAETRIVLSPPAMA